VHPYVKFYRAAYKKDAHTLVRLIQQHPELHEGEGPRGSLLEIWIVLRRSCWKLPLPLV
jgi:hypothetical protein